MVQIEVVNKHNHESTEFDVDISRNSVLGNPFTSNKGRTKAKTIVDTKTESIAEYRKYLQNEIIDGNMAIINKLKDIFEMSQQTKVYLVCTCKPKPCHGDVIKRIIEDMEYSII